MSHTTPTYSIHPSIAHTADILRNLPKTTGRSLNEWMALLEKQHPGTDDKARRDWLQGEFKLGGATAWLIAERSLGKGFDFSDETAYLAAAPGYVDKMYENKKAHLRPIHDALISLAHSLGHDVKICPCQTIVPFYRKRVFAEIKPVTIARVDLGLALKGCPAAPPARLVDTGGLLKNDRITHRFGITSPEEIDSEVKAWLTTAYDLDK